MPFAISAEVAKQLAYYKSEQGPGVLAPRGWNCFGVYGSSGYGLYVSPEGLTAKDALSFNWKGFSGPAIEVARAYGETSGRFSVARVIARVFPARKTFVKDVIAEGIAPASSFPFGPYPTDKLNYRTEQTVEYETPANTDGLGTHSRLIKSADSIKGVAILVGAAPDLITLAVRLPSNQSQLATLIIEQFERDPQITAF